MRRESGIARSIVRIIARPVINQYIGLINNRAVRRTRGIVRSLARSVDIDIGSRIPCVPLSPSPSPSPMLFSRFLVVFVLERDSYRISALGIIAISNVTGLSQLTVAPLSLSRARRRRFSCPRRRSLLSLARGIIRSAFEPVIARANLIESSRRYSAAAFSSYLESSFAIFSSHRRSCSFFSSLFYLLDRAIAL